MLGYRSIGLDEFFMLVESNNPVYGMRKWLNTPWTNKIKNPPNYGVVCFFKEDYKWRDKRHIFDIVVELKDPIEGIGVYQASKALARTHIWYGRDGKTEYKLPELYVRSYSLEDVVAINLNNFFNSTVTEQYRKMFEFKGIKFIG